jgi:hypothetical protein
MGATFVIAVAPVTYGVGIIGLDAEGHACADILARLGLRNGLNRISHLQRAEIRGE